MLFNSLDFAFFLPLVFSLYWLFNKSIKIQNIVLVLASYYFYSCWDWRFLSLIVISTMVDYNVGLALHKEESQKKRKALLWLSIIVNLGFLGFFKYCNFFIEQFIQSFALFGIAINVSSLNIILPVGISFYTFQTMSYTLDIYRKKITACNDFIAFSSFVSFFPQLVAGPIERASNLLPQFSFKRKFSSSEGVAGLQQILWGLFKKVVIADNCAEIADLIFNNYTEYSGGVLILGAFFFTFQIYGDFSGYSDIAIGTSRLFGLRLMKNFAFPYFSRDIAEFWRRWHISLSSWFRDYVYIPLGGSRVNKLKNIRNIFIVFTVSGFWHGANWTFIIWGALNALLFLPLLITDNNRNHLEIVAKGRLFPSIKELFSIGLTFLLTMIAWVFFRAETLVHAWSYIEGIFHGSLLSMLDFEKSIQSLVCIILIVFFIILEWFGREGEFAIDHIAKHQNRLQRWLLYAFLIFLIGMYVPTNENAFIYFQF